MLAFAISVSGSVAVMLLSFEYKSHGLVSRYSLAFSLTELTVSADNNSLVPICKKASNLKSFWGVKDHLIALLWKASLETLTKQKILQGTCFLNEYF